MIDPRVIKYGPWSTSKIGTLQNCSEQFVDKYILRQKESSKSSQAQVGVAGHSVLEKMIKARGSAQVPVLDTLIEQTVAEMKLPTQEADAVRLQRAWIVDYLDRLAAFQDAVEMKEEYTEQKLGMTASYEIASFHDDPDIFFRGVVDYAIRTKDDYLIIWDHKFGRRKPIKEHHAQLCSYMLLALVNWPDIKGFQCGINYYGREEIDWFPRQDGTSGVWTAPEVVQYVVPWFEQYLNTLTKRLTVIDQTGAGVPEPGWVCEFCGFVDRCPPGQQKVAERQAKRATAKNV